MTVPKHVAIIMDGNRRFSKRLMAKPWQGHEWGAKKLERVIEWCRELGVEELTVYALSVQNFSRPKDEFAMLMKVFENSCDDLLKKINVGENIGRVVFIGRLSMFHDSLKEKMYRIMESTQANSTFRLNIALAYGGREEVIDAVKRVGEQVAAGKLNVDEINDAVFEKALYMNREPDLVIRTGGERRTSNFLIWQAHYSEWVFVEKLWPEFEKEDFIEAVSSFESRERRFGK